MLRAATISDIPAMFSIRTAVTENPLSLDQLKSLGITPGSVAASLEAGYRAWVIEANTGQVSAFAIADHASASIFALFTRPGFERRGYGSALLEVAARDLFHSGAAVIWLTTGSGSPAAHFYRQRGWRDAGIIANGETRFERSASDPPSPPGEPLCRS
jgi:ribosomal protein S18 acetylase RimI-like enzyme